MAPAGFEPAIAAIERSRTHALHCGATGIGLCYLIKGKFITSLYYKAQHPPNEDLVYRFRK